MTERRLRLLLVEDSADDAELIARTLRAGGFALQQSCVDSPAALREALADREYDVAITDHRLPGFDSTEVLRIVDELAPGLPCLLVSDKVGEEPVALAMRNGAADYVAKDGLGALPAAIERALLTRERKRQRLASDEALTRSGRMFEAVFDNSLDAMLIIGDDRRVAAANPAAVTLLMASPQDLALRPMEDLLPRADRPNARRGWEAFIRAGRQSAQSDVLRPDGTRIAVEYRAVANFVPGRHIVVMRDISMWRAAEAEAERQIARQHALTDFGKRALREENVDLLMEAAAESVVVTLGSEAASVLELRVGERAFVTRAQAGLAATPSGVPIPAGDPAGSQPAYTVRSKEPVIVEDYAHEKRFECDPTLVAWGARSALSVEIPGDLQAFGVLATASTQIQAFAAEDTLFVAAIANIIADALKRLRSEEAMRELALHDSLTGLPNRTLFFDRLTVALARTQRLGTHVAILFMDVDHFKSYNDALGHRAADRLLTQVGARIERTMRDTDTVARFGGDEFVVLCEDLATPSDAEIVTARLVSAFESPFSFDEEQHQLTASIGVTVSSPENLDAETLLRDADLAMYSSKDSGRARSTLATEELRVATLGRSEIKRDLKRAIEADELVLHYQPIVALADGELCAVEALVRWDDPVRGLVPPGEFIPLAEESGPILALGEWVLRAACRQAADWRARFAERAPLPVHINVSARQIAQPDLPSLVARVLDETGVPASDIALEITETALVDTTGVASVTLGELKKMGVRVVLDDFGTGYSSLSYLEEFPIDVLKIDRAFVSRLNDSGAPAPIVTAIIGVARALAVGTIAEGVETAQQSAAVVALGCRHAQGYFFARPAPAAAIEQLIRDDSPLRARAAEASALLSRTPVLFGGSGTNEQWPRPPASVDKYREAFLEALLAVDSRQAQQLVSQALANDLGPDTIDAQIIGSSMIEIGHMWERGEASIGQEHLATGIASQAAWLAAAKGTFAGSVADPPGSQTAILASVDGESHVLGLRMASDMLQLLGIEVRYLGSKVPSSELCDSVAEVQPEIIGLSLTMPELAPVLEEQLAALRAVCPEAQVLLGGQGVTPQLAESTGATYVGDAEALVDVVGSRPRPLTLVG